MAALTLQFPEVIDAIFKGWTALQLAVAHSFGGTHSKAKAEWFVEATEQWMKENSDVDAYELEDFLAEIMSAEFNTVVDDNSLVEVATKICKIYRLICQGEYEQVNNIVSTLQKSAPVTSSQKQQVDSDEDDDDDDMDVANDNVTNHMNALELNRTANESSPSASGHTNSDQSNGTSQSNDNSQSNEEDGWINVTKGGKPKR